LSLLRSTPDCWAPYARAWRDPYCLQILLITRSRRTFESQNSASAMEHSWRSRVYIIDYYRLDWRTSGRNPQFPCGCSPQCSARYLPYLQFRRPRLRSQSRRHPLRKKRAATRFSVVVNSSCLDGQNGDVGQVLQHLLPADPRCIRRVSEVRCPESP